MSDKPKLPLLQFAMFPSVYFGNFPSATIAHSYEIERPQTFGYRFYRKMAVQMRGHVGDLYRTLVCGVRVADTLQGRMYPTGVIIHGSILVHIMMGRVAHGCGHHVGHMGMMVESAGIMRHGSGGRVKIGVEQQLTQRRR